MIGLMSDKKSVPWKGIALLLGAMLVTYIALLALPPDWRSAMIAFLRRQ